MLSAPTLIVSAAMPSAVSMPSRCIVTSSPGGWPTAFTVSEVPICENVSRKKRSPRSNAPSAGRYSFEDSGFGISNTDHSALGPLRPMPRPSRSASPSTNVAAANRHDDSDGATRRGASTTAAINPATSSGVVAITRGLHSYSSGGSGVPSSCPAAVAISPYATVAVHTAAPSAGCALLHRPRVWPTAPERGRRSAFVRDAT